MQTVARFPRHKHGRGAVRVGLAAVVLVVTTTSDVMRGMFTATLGTRPAQASIVRAMDLRELTGQADRVVVGKVLSINSAWERDRKRIFTNIEIQVDETWKGPTPPGSKVTIQQPGGQVGDIEMRVFGLAEFTVGQRAVLFLKGSPQASSVLGLGQGMRPLQFDQTARKWMVQGGERSAAVKTDPSGKFIPAAPDPIVPLETLRASVRRLVQP